MTWLERRGDLNSEGLVKQTGRKGRQGPIPYNSEEDRPYSLQLVTMVSGRGGNRRRGDQRREAREGREGTIIGQNVELPWGDLGRGDILPAQRRRHASRRNCEG